MLIMLQISPALLRRFRRLEDLTQLQLAERAGIAYWRYTRLESGVARARPSEARALLAAMPLLAQAIDAARDKPEPAR